MLPSPNSTTPLASQHYTTPQQQRNILLFCSDILWLTQVEFIALCSKHVILGPWGLGVTKAWSPTAIHFNAGTYRRCAHSRDGAAEDCLTSISRVVIGRFNALVVRALFVTAYFPVTPLDEERSGAGSLASRRARDPRGASFIYAGNLHAAGHWRFFFSFIVLNGVASAPFFATLFQYSLAFSLRHCACGNIKLRRVHNIICTSRPQKTPVLCFTETSSSWVYQID